MRFVIQRVQNASVTVDEEVIGQIGRGYMVLVGVSEEDDESTADKMVDKMIKLRINEDEERKTNLSLADVGGELLMISQFTLYEQVPVVEKGAFGEHMKVELLNDGPFTIILDSEDLAQPRN